MVGCSNIRNVHLRENHSKETRWDVTPNDAVSDKGLMEEWYSFFNQSEMGPLQKIIKQRQFKLKNIEAEI